MKNSKFFDEHSSNCELCEKWITLESGEKGCAKTGSSEQTEKCKKFVYDPLKRIPAKRRPLQKFTKEDFEL